MDVAERTMPHDLVAEKAVLGAILIRPLALREVADLVVSGDFYRDAHRQIYARMVDLDEAGTVIDLVTIRAALLRDGGLDEVGGPAYIASLTDGVPTSTNARHYAVIVREHALRRRALNIANKTMAAAYEADRPAADVAAEASDELLD